MAIDTVGDLCRVSFYVMRDVGELGNDVSCVAAGINGRYHSQSRRRTGRRLSFRVCDDLIDVGHEI